MDQYTVKEAITPLRLIFWGGLLCLFDITLSETTNGQGMKFDILNDVVGTLVIAVGVFRLKALPVNDRYDEVMRFVKAVSVLAVFDAIRDHFITPLHSVAQFAFNAFGLASLVAIVVFCIAMRWFCEDANLFEASRSWSTTTVLFIVIYLFPLGLVYIISALAIVADTPFNIDLGPAGIPLLPVFAFPFIHLFLSTSRMQRAAEDLAVAE